MRIHNLCTSCGLDFGSIQAFDAHRVGTHDYTYQEGLRMEPMQENGRRCLTEAEIATARDKRGTLRFARNSRGVWTLSSKLDAAQRLRRKLAEAS